MNNGIKFIIVIVIIVTSSLSFCQMTEDEDTVDWIKNIVEGPDTRKGGPEENPTTTEQITTAKPISRHGCKRKTTVHPLVRGWLSNITGRKSDDECRENDNSTDKGKENIDVDEELMNVINNKSTKEKSRELNLNSPNESLSNNVENKNNNLTSTNDVDGTLLEMINSGSPKENVIELNRNQIDINANVDSLSKNGETANTKLTKAVDRGNDNKLNLNPIETNTNKPLSNLIPNHGEISNSKETEDIDVMLLDIINSGISEGNNRELNPWHSTVDTGTPITNFSPHNPKRQSTKGVDSTLLDIIDKASPKGNNIVLNLNPIEKNFDSTLTSFNNVNPTNFKTNIDINHKSFTFQNDEDKTCVTKDGERGVCVQLFLCNPQSILEPLNSPGFVLVVGVISHAFSQGVNDYETAAWISKIGNSNNGRQFMINQKYDRASTETSILKRDNINTMVDSTRKGDDVLEKRFLDPVSSVEAKDVSCVLDDGESGVCVFYYQCNVTTHVVITDGSSILSKRQKGCSNNLHVCCKDNNLKELNNNTVMIEQTYTSDNNVHKDEHHDGLSKSSDPFINGHPFKGGTELNLDPVQEDDNYTLCISDEGESGVCVFYFQCNVTTRVVITDGSDIINARQRACPDILRVCCNRHYLISSTETTTANMDDDNNENPIKLTPVKYSNEEKRKNNIGPYTLGSSLTFIHNDSKPTQEVTEINLDPIDIKKDDDVSCVLDDGGSGVCVFYYQCNVTTHVVITDGSSILNPRQRRCPSILQVCCKENKSKSTMAITNTTTSNIKHDSGKRPTLTNFSSIVTSNNKYEHNQNFESSTIYALPTFAQTMQKNTIKPPIEVTEINLDPIDAQDGDVQCVRDDGASGVCVFYYQCTAHGVVTDGSGIINFRQGRCPSILQVCCKKNNLKSSKEITSDKGKNNTYSTVPTSDITINIVDQLMKNKESHFSTMPAHQVSHTNLHSKGARDYDVSCVLDDGESGVCVFYDQCNVITDGFSILRSRTGRCSSILYICCKNNHINSHHETSPLNTESLRVRYYKHLMQLTSTNSNNNNNVDWHKRSTRLSNIDDLSPNIDTLESKTNNTDELKDTKLDSVVFRDDDDWSCVLDDGESGVCVFYYQCNVTRVVITDGSHIINAKRKCPSILQVCCEQNDIKTSTRISDTTKANAEDKYKDTTGGADVMPEIDLDPVTSPDDPLCETDNGEIGFCVMYYQCESTNRTLIKDGSTIINFRRKSCPNYLEVCCTENATPPQEIMEMSISKEIGSPLNGKTNTNDLMGNKSNEGTSTYIHISFYLFTILFLCFI